MHDATAGRFCWVDLAATDASRAIGFYGELFGWSASEQAANGGTFVRLTHEGREIGSLYQLRRDVGLSSHWTPYVRVQSAAGTCDRVVALGGRVAVAPFEVDGVARIALVVDPTGASFGLWEEIA
jgi:predicted enzyme related to lactoylglutathione lyase